MTHRDDHHDPERPTSAHARRRPPRDAARRAVALLTGTLRHRELEAPDQGRTLAVNVGAAGAPEDGVDAEALLRRADDRMYEDKRRRRGER